MWRDYDHPGGIVSAPRRPNGLRPAPVPGGRDMGGEFMTVYTGPVFEMAVNQFAVMPIILRSHLTSATACCCRSGR
jgi:hypothetical protein